MLRIIHLLLTASVIIIVASCTNRTSYEAKILELTHERDSLNERADSTEKEYNTLISYLSKVETALDSIAQEENMLSIKNGEIQLSRMELKERVYNFGLLLQRQRAYIQSIEDSLRTTKGSTTHLLTMITTLRQQLDSKEQEIKQIKLALQSERRSVADLQKSLNTLSQSKTQLEMQNQQLEQVMQTQNKAINIGYILIASKKELESLRILTKGGLFKKQKLNYSAFKEDIFNEIDMRNLSPINITGKNAKILTPIPKESYTMNKTSKDQWILKIISPADFWSVSNYLVIQTD